MPYSSTNGKRFVQSCVDLIKHKRRAHNVLDLGAGSGTYSDLFRKQLAGSWTAVEIWEPYINQFNLAEKYDSIIISDARNFFLMADVRCYDVIFIGDMLEHLPKHEAKELIKLAKQFLTQSGIILASVPIGEYPQDEYMGNPYEKHLATWEKADLEAYKGQRSKDCNVLTHYEGEIGVLAFGALPVYIQTYSIAKNESKFILRMLNSAKLFTTLTPIVGDTGSIDATKELTNGKAKLINLHVSPFRFDDARNAVLGAIPLIADYAISIDCDEEITADSSIDALVDIILDELANTGSLPDVINHNFKTIWDWEDVGANISSHYHNRVHRRQGCRWVHPVHEKIVWSSGAPREAWCLKFTMVQKPDLSKDRSSYLAGLQVAVREDPHDWKLFSFLADELINTDYAGAQQAINTAKSLPDSNKAFLTLKQAFYARQWLKREDALAYFAEAAQLGSVREYYVYLAEHMDSIGVDSKAQWRAAKLFSRETTGYERREDCWNDSIEKLKD